MLQNVYLLSEKDHINCDTLIHDAIRSYLLRHVLGG